MTSAAITTISRTEDEQLAAARTLLGLEVGDDIVNPLKALIQEKLDIRNTLQVTVAVTELTVKNLRKQILDIQVLLADMA